MLFFRSFSDEPTFKLRGNKVLAEPTSSINEERPHGRRIKPRNTENVFSTLQKATSGNSLEDKTVMSPNANFTLKLKEIDFSYRICERRGSLGKRVGLEIPEVGRDDRCSNPKESKARFILLLGEQIYPEHARQASPSTAPNILGNARRASYSPGMLGVIHFSNEVWDVPIHITPGSYFCSLIVDHARGCARRCLASTTAPGKLLAKHAPRGEPRALKICSSSMLRTKAKIVGYMEPLGEPPKTSVPNILGNQ
uniref:Uncharacterized protein n=1 Tax=Romanomermis culicivorax TaxID=13658 RepID=A0A915I4E2_ROMCU